MLGATRLGELLIVRLRADDAERRNRHSRSYGSGCVPLSPTRPRADRASGQRRPFCNDRHDKRIPMELTPREKDKLCSSPRPCLQSVARGAA